MKLTTGRPSNIYRSTPNDFAAYWKAAEKFTKVEDALEPGFGAQAYEVTKAGVHAFRLTLIPTDVSGAFFWFRFDTPDRGVEFSPPSLLARADLPALLELWEFTTPQWLIGNGLMASPLFPEKWTMPKVFTTCTKTFDVLTGNRTTSTFSLTTRGGVHTMRTPELTVGGVLGEHNLWRIVEHVRSSVDRISLPKTSSAPLPSQLVTELRKLSAEYTKRTVLTPSEERMMGVVPHADLLSIPHTSVSPYAP